MLTFKIDPKGNSDKDGNEYPGVTVSCKNCGTISGLDETIKEEGKTVEIE